MVNSFLETEKLGKLMRQYSLPCIISLLVGALYNIVDQIFIANADYLGSYGNAANTVVFPLTVIALAIATMIGDGCCAYVSISLGAKENKRAAKSVGNAVAFTVLAGFVLMAVYLIFSNQILTSFGATVNKNTWELSKEYLFWIALGIPFYMFGQEVNPMIRSDGSPRYAMITLLAGAVTNCILDPVFIFVFHWGMMGAAVATVIGQIISAVLALLYLFGTKAVSLSKDSFKPQWTVIKNILPLGMSSFLSQISIVLSMAAVLNMCRKCGAVHPVFALEEYSQIPTAVIGIVMKFFQIIMSVAIGLSAGCIPIIGYNVGAGRNDRTLEILKRLLIYEFVFGLAATVVFELFPMQLIGIFGAKSESGYYTKFAIKCIRVFLCGVSLSCVNKGIFIYLQALGNALGSTLLSLLRELVCGVGLVLILPLWFGLDGLLYFMPISDVVTLAVAFFVLFAVIGQLKTIDR